MVHIKCNIPSFYEIQRINERTAFPGKPNIKAVTCSRKSMSPIIYLLITEHYATLKELRDEYTVEEMLDLYEACSVSLYNKSMAIQSARDNSANVRRNK